MLTFPGCCVRLDSQYDENARHALDTMLKRKDRLDFYPCVADAVLDASDHAYHEVIAEIVFMIFAQKPLDAWQRSCLRPYCELSFTHSKVLASLVPRLSSSSSFYMRDSYLHKSLNVREREPWRL